MFREATKVVGYLLETNGTTGSMAECKNGWRTYTDDPKACKFCLLGAVTLVGRKFLFDEEIFYQYVKSFLGVDDLVNTWEGPGCSRETVVKKLKSA